MGIIGTRTFTKEIPGIAEIKEKNRARIESGMLAVTAMETLRKQKNDVAAKEMFEAHKKDLGFGLLLKKYTEDVSKATPEMIQLAVDSTVPRVAPMFWSFRVMVALGFSFALLLGLSLYHTVRGTFLKQRWLMRWAVLFIPMPWIAAELGWFVAEYGRQPWTIYGVLPTHLSVSSLTVNSLYGSLAGFVLFYTGLLIIEMYLMVKFARKGPSSLGTGRYHSEFATLK